MFVVKVGGSEGIDLAAVCRDVAALHAEGQRLVLVHGGSHRTNVVAEALGHAPQFVTSVSGYTSRRTDRETLRIFEMVYCGEVNKSIVEMLQAAGANAVGLSGLDGRLLEGERKAAIKIVENGRRRVLRDDYTGTVTTVNTALLNLLLDNGYLPVVTPPAISTAHEAINVDGDRAAAMIAAALGAEQLVILSNIPGLLREFPDESTLVSGAGRGSHGPRRRPHAHQGVGRHGGHRARCRPGGVRRWPDRRPCAGGIGRAGHRNRLGILIILWRWGSERHGD
jgi:acetylglutamate/LysW-gamma-L-alpha-aminoadipate kinase